MDAIIFDFDGVVVDSEPVHLACFQQVLRTIGLELGEEAYYTRYLGYDDHDCLLLAARDAGLALSEERIAGLTAAKTRLVQRTFAESIRPLPGAAELIHAAAAAHVPLAICSGALRGEIELAAQSVGVLDCFQVIVSARDVTRGKPDPQGYVQALRLLAQAAGRELAPARCVVVEDAPAGIEAGKAAGMKVLAVATSYTPNHLAAADRIVARLSGVTLRDLETMI